ncbi:MAG: lytic murein transglycosylase [Geminicoccaceae bacterium]|nr:lytic murein transglycosylase [Geminicoccaceae bacterium]
MPMPRPLGPALLACLLLAPLSARADFAGWLGGLRAEALRAGVSAATLDAALDGIAPIDRVVELDRRQPEGRLSYPEYRERVVTRARIDKGRDLLERHRDLLARTEARYGVPAEVIVALWGIESSFGEFKGRFSVVESLATLAYEGRRADFFKGELISALKIIDAGNVSPRGMYGSWAGAMGQSQFMPSTFLGYAVDGDGDGRRDIWTSLPDTFASMANYLGRMGWDPGYVWGREVEAPRAVAKAHAGLERKAPLGWWQERGVRRLDGRSLPDVPIDASLLAMGEGEGAPPWFLAYHNYRVLMRWNRSTYFATSVGLLADAIREGTS